MNAQLESVTDACIHKFVGTDTRNAVCYLCNAAIPAGVPLVIRKARRPDDTYTWRRVVCLDCSPGRGEGSPAFYCKTCRRPVHYAKRTTLPRYCSRPCRYASRLVKPVAAVCSICGKAFIPPRNDARTCSPACRQKAYRLRYYKIADPENG